MHAIRRTHTRLKQIRDLAKASRMNMYRLIQKGQNCKLYFTKFTFLTFFLKNICICEQKSSIFAPIFNLTYCRLDKIHI